MANVTIAREDARAQGLNRFCNREVCRHGHLCERYVVDGKCVACVAKLAKIRSKRWATLNPEKMKEKTLRWRLANPDVFKNSNRQNKLRNQKKYNESQRIDYAANPDKYLRSTKKYYAKNRQRMIERATINGRTRRAQKKGSGGSHTAADLRSILAAQKFRCVYCPADLRKVKRHVDHIHPLSCGGSNDKTNIQISLRTLQLIEGRKRPDRIRSGTWTPTLTRKDHHNG